jgi:hypothetical protein
MRANKSGTINTSGGSTWRAMSVIALYAASKAAINGLSSPQLPPLFRWAVSIALQI